MYDHQQIDQILASGVDIGGTTATEVAVGSQPITVTTLWGTITTAHATATATVTFSYRPTPGSASGATTLGTLVITTGAAGRQFYKNVTPFKCAPGGTIHVVSDGGGDSGVATLGIRQYPTWEHPSNNTAQIASA